MLHWNQLQYTLCIYLYTCIYNTKTIICLFTNKLNLAFLLLHMTFDGLFQERNDFNLVQLA